MQGTDPSTTVRTPPERSTAVPGGAHASVEADLPKAAPRIDIGSLRPRRIIGKAEVCELTGKSYPTIWGWMKSGKFPRSRLLPSGGVAWYSDQVADFLDNLPVQRLLGDEDAAGQPARLADGKVQKRQRDVEALGRKAAATTRAPRGQGRRKKHA